MSQYNLFNTQQNDHHIKISDSSSTENFEFLDSTHLQNSTEFQTNHLEIEPAYFPLSICITGTIIQGLLFFSGMIGNILVVLVVTRSRSMWSATNCYLVSLAISDCVVLVAAVPQEIVSYYLVGGRWIWGDVGCTLSVFLQNFGINASSLTVAAFTIERYIAICKPLLARTMCTVGRAIKIVFWLWIFAAVYSTPWLFLSTTVPLHYHGYPPLKMCDHKLSREQYLGYYFTDLLLFYIIPLLLCIIIYSRIAWRLSRRNEVVAVAYSVERNEVELLPTSRNSTRNKTQVIKMLALVCIFFAILWLPYRGLLVYNSVAEEKFMNLWYLMMAKSCVYLNSTINALLYNAMSIKFRQAFARLLCF